jgi:predicted nucleic acid-binding protein
VIVIADTGPLYALVDRSDSWHLRVLEWWKRNRATVVIPVCVLPEVTYLLQTRIGPDAEEAFVRSVADEEFAVEPLEPEDLGRAADLMRQYADLKLGFVDATVIATAERLDARQLLSSDRRHFQVVRPRHARAFALFP